MKNTIKRIFGLAITAAVILIGLAVIGVISRNSDDTRQNQEPTDQSQETDYQQSDSSIDSSEITSDPDNLPEVPDQNNQSPDNGASPQEPTVPQVPEETNP